MIYIKYIDKDEPFRWVIYAHEKGSKTETMIVSCTGSTYPYKDEFNLNNRREHWKIKYLTKKEVDLLKLELL